VVEGYDGFFSSGQGYVNVEREMREYTAKVGGNVLLPLYARSNSFSGITSRGQAYRCP